MSAKIQQVYRRKGVTLTLVLEATNDAAGGSLYASLVPVIAAVEDFMFQYPTSPDSGEGDR